VNNKIRDFLNKGKEKLRQRLRRKNYSDQKNPMFRGGNIRYSITEKEGAVGYGGIGAMHTLARRLKLDRLINQGVRLLQRHVPYHESDHVLSMAYNILTGGICLEDLKRLRQDEGYTKGLGAERIPDATTAGDFLRRFDEPSVIALQEACMEARKKVWRQQTAVFFEEAILDADGTIAETTGECKEGMDIAYNGQWGYAPLVISLAQTKEVLYTVNRSGSRPSSEGAAVWLDRAIGHVAPYFKKIWLRGDTDFSQTQYLDGWNKRGIGFVFGYDAMANVIKLAEGLPKKSWQRLTRQPRYEVQTEERERPENIKEQIVKEREFQNIRLRSEDVAEFDYRPTSCKETYRMVVVRKNLTVEKGERRLFDEIRFFFYLTNDRRMATAEVVFFANDRCDQENLIAQLKTGVHAMKMPVADLDSNWAYMVIGSLAWNLKAWYGLLMPDKAQGRKVVRMEFRSFVLQFMLLPCQVVKTGRCLVYRILKYTEQLKAFFATFDRIRALIFT
jgi:hypothetical protein